MKKITFSRKQILSAIHAACVALLFVTFAGKANADDIGTFYNFFTAVPGPLTTTIPTNYISTTTGNFGTSTRSGYFYDNSTNNDTVIIQGGTDIGNKTEWYYNGVDINQGTVTVQQNATLFGGSSCAETGSGIYIHCAGTVTNAGNVSGYEDGVYIGGGGTVKNTGSIEGCNYDGIEIDGGGTVTNTDGGTISGDRNGVSISGGGTVINGANSSISGDCDGISLCGGGTVTNSGSIQGYDGDGIKITGGGTVTNVEGGTICGDDAGVYISGGGTVTNGANSSITGYENGVYICGTGLVTNAGTIQSTEGSAVDIQGCGTVINSGTISGPCESEPCSNHNAAVYISGQGIVTNTGSIYASAYKSDAIYLGGSGSIVTNSSSGSICDSGCDSDAIYASGCGTTVNNYGSIFGEQTAIYLDNGGTVNNGGSISSVDGPAIEAKYGFSTVTSTGSIQSCDSAAIDLAYGGNVTLAGGSVTGGECDAIELNTCNECETSTVTVIGRADITGKIYEATCDSGPGTLTLNLVGLTPSKLAQLNCLNGDICGTYCVGGYTYTWQGLALNAEGVSLEQVVNPAYISIATAIDNANTNGNLPTGFDPFLVAAAGNANAAIAALEGGQINTTLDIITVNLGTTIATDIQQHLDAILTGGQLGGIDLGGMHVSEAGSMYAMGDTSSQLQSILNMTGSSAFGGAEMSTDTTPMVSAPKGPNWGVWASGDVTLGDESGSNGLPGFHSTLGSPTLGFDYRVSSSLVIGVLGSYTTGNASLNDGSNIGLNTEIAALYGSWRSGNWHVTGLAGGGVSQYNNSRITVGGLTADSSPRGDDILTDFTGGYDFHLGDHWDITPEVGVQYTHIDIDSYTESGAGVFDLAQASQDIDSLRSHVGFKLDKSFKLGQDLTFIPELRAQWYHEFLDDSRGVSASLPGAPALGSFSVQTGSPQRDFALVGVGLNTAFTGYKGIPIALFVNYDAQVGQDNYIANSVNAGVRVDF